MMGGVIPVDTADDPRLADYARLTDAELRRNDVVIVEGVLAIEKLLASEYRLRSLLVTPNRLKDLGDLPGIEAPVFVADLAVLQGVTGFNIHRGALASADRTTLPAVSDVLRDSAMVAVLEGINDHENMGVIFRNAAALGVDGLVLCPRCCDPLYRRSIRVSMGHVLHQPFARLAHWPAGLGEVRSAGFTVVALTPDWSATAIDEVEWRGYDKVAVMLGAEGAGLTAEAMASADIRVRIPMASGVDSINVGSAAAIAFHAISRRRGRAPGRS
jgi:tRNA G18 (ribose-2'-O)-methylase SpoU